MTIVEHLKVIFTSYKVQRWNDHDQKNDDQCPTGHICTAHPSDAQFKAEQCVTERKFGFLNYACNRGVGVGVKVNERGKKDEKMWI